MIDLTKLKSAVSHSDESRVAELILAADEQWTRAYPLQAAKGLSGTTVKEEGSRIAVVKRVPSALAPPPSTREDVADLAKQRGFDWADGHADRVLDYWASDDRTDRHGDRVNQVWKFQDFEANPIMLDSHDWGGLTIGGVVDWTVKSRTDGSWTGDALALKCLFATAETYQKADTIYRLAKAGFLRGGSVGFLPETVIEVRDKKEREQLGLGRQGLIFSDCGLIEWSTCSVPAHSRAGLQLNRAKSLGLLQPHDAQVLRQLRRAEMRDDDAWKREDVELVGAWRALFPDARLPDDPADPEVLVGGARVRGITELFETLLTDLRTTMNEIKQISLDIRDGLEIEPSDASQRLAPGTEAAGEDPEDQAEAPEAPGEAPDPEDQAEPSEPSTGAKKPFGKPATAALGTNDTDENEIRAAILALAAEA